MTTHTHKHSQARHINLRRIWDDLYRVVMHAGDMRSIEEKLARPDLMSGDRGIDKAQQNALAPCYISINDMVEFYKDGVQFQISGPEDALKILKAVMDHTGTWREATQTTLNLYDAPMDDLIAMEEFAASIYDIAKYKIHEGSQEQAMLNRASANTFTRGSGLARNVTINGQAPKVNRTKTTSEVEQLAYEPDVAVFRQALTSMGGPGNGERRY